MNMNETSSIHEKFVFFATRKDGCLMLKNLEELLSLQLDRILVDYDDRPDQEFSHINERTKKILGSLPEPARISRIWGQFSQGGNFEMKSTMLIISLLSEEYNFEVVDSMRKFLGPNYHLCIFQNHYIWGVDIYQDYTRERFFETRIFISRSQHLEQPQIDIFRRDNGIIYKFRFHLVEEFHGIDFDEGIRLLHPLFSDLLECMKKRSYEGIEVLYLYCTDKAKFRRFETRTKIGQRLKNLLECR